MALVPIAARFLDASAGFQLKLAFDGSNFVTLGSDANGRLDITPLPGQDVNVVDGGIRFANVLRLTEAGVLQNVTMDAALLTGLIADARVPASAVTQHEAALSLAATQLTGLLADARVQESNVTQHEAALSIGAGQITGTLDADTLDGIDSLGFALASHTHPMGDLTGVLPIASGGTGAGTAALAFDAIKQSASDSYRGAVELATQAEINAATADRVIEMGAFKGSKHGTKVIIVELFGATQATATGVSRYVPIPSAVDGMNLVSVRGHVITPGVGSDTTFDVHKDPFGANLTMLVNKVSIQASERDSDDHTTPPTIDSANDDVVDGDLLRVDCDAIASTTPAIGGIVTLEFQDP